MARIFEKEPAVAYDMGCSEQIHRHHQEKEAHGLANLLANFGGRQQLFVPVFEKVWKLKHSQTCGLLWAKVDLPKFLFRKRFIQGFLQSLAVLSPAEQLADSGQVREGLQLQMDVARGPSTICTGVHHMWFGSNAKIQQLYKFVAPC